MDHDSRHGGYVENGSAKLESTVTATLAIATCTATITDAPESALWARGAFLMRGPGLAEPTWLSGRQQNHVRTIFFCLTFTKWQTARNL